MEGWILYVSNLENLSDSFGECDSDRINATKGSGIPVQLGQPQQIRGYLMERQRTPILRDLEWLRDTETRIAT
jgi:hypothetical protein